MTEEAEPMVMNEGAGEEVKAEEKVVEKSEKKEGVVKEWRPYVDPTTLELPELMEMIKEHHERNKQRAERCRRLRLEIERVRTSLKKKKPSADWEDVTIRFIHRDYMVSSRAKNAEAMKRDPASLLNVHCQLHKCPNPTVEYESKKPEEGKDMLVYICKLTLLQTLPNETAQPYQAKGVNFKSQKKDARHDCARALLLTLYPGVTSMDEVAQRLLDKRKEVEAAQVHNKPRQGAGRGRGRWVSVRVAPEGGAPTPKADGDTEMREGN